MRSKTRLIVTGAFGSALTAGAILVSGGSLSPITGKFPGLSTEVRAAGSRLSASEAEARARIGRKNRLTE